MKITGNLTSAECPHGEPRGERYCPLCRYPAKSKKRGNGRVGVPRPEYLDLELGEADARSDEWVAEP